MKLNHNDPRYGRLDTLNIKINEIKKKLNRAFDSLSTKVNDITKQVEKNQRSLNKELDKTNRFIRKHPSIAKDNPLNETIRFATLAKDAENRTYQILDASWKRTKTEWESFKKKKPPLDNLLAHKLISEMGNLSNITKQIKTDQSHCVTAIHQINEANRELLQRINREIKTQRSNKSRKQRRTSRNA